MTLRVCLDCTTAFAVGVRLCPHCGSERNAEQGAAEELGILHGIPVETEENMPKITRHEGASFAPVEDQADETEGGEQPSDGSSSETSSEKPSTKDETSGPATPKPARKTASRSGKGRTATQDSSAGTADGGPAGDTSETGSADSAGE